MPLRYDVIAADKFSSIFERLGDWLHRTDSDVSTVTSSLSGMDDALSMLGTVAIGFGMALGSEQLMQFAGEAIVSAAAVEQLRDEMRRLGDEKGVDVDRLLADFKQASAGMMDDRALVTSINRALKLGGAELANSLPQLAAMARQAARELDKPFEQAFNSIVNAIANGNASLLNSLGYTVDVAKAHEDYAKKLGVSTDALTDQQEATAVLTDLLGDYGAAIDAAGDKALTDAEKISALSSATNDLKTSIGLFLLAAGAPSAAGGAANVIGNEADIISSTRRMADARRGVMEYIEVLRDLGDEQGATIITEKYLALALKAVVPGLTRNKEAYAEVVAEVDSLVGSQTIATEQTTAWALAMSPATTQTTSWALAMHELGKQTGWVNRQMRVARQNLETGMWTADDAGINPFRQNITGGQWTSEDWLQAGDMSASAELAGEEIAGAFSSGFSSAMARLESDIQTAALSGLDVTSDDFMEGYVDAPLEAVRRLRDIANLGTASPWAKMFEIPEDVLRQGEDAVKRWADNMAERGAQLRDISLIDKDAFLRELQEIQTAAEEQKVVMDKLTQWAIEAGLTPEDARSYAENAVGRPSGEGTVDGLLQAFGEQDLGGDMAKMLKDSVKEAKKDYYSVGESMGAELWQGLLEYVEGQSLVIPTTLAGVPVSPDVGAPGTTAIGSNGELE